MTTAGSGRPVKVNKGFRLLTRNGQRYVDNRSDHPLGKDPAGFNWDCGMFKGWKISSFNGVFVASYLIPAWAVPALEIVEFPVRGLYARANISPAIFASDYLQFGGVAMMRFAWLLALAKLTVVAFFAVFLALTLRERTRNRGADEEALSFALILGSFISMASMLFAAKVGELEALRLHATESLLLASIGIVMVVESASEPVSKPLVQSENASSPVVSLPLNAQPVLARDVYLSSPNS